jgi:hypothetical protein
MPPDNNGAATAAHPLELALLGLIAAALALRTLLAALLGLVLNGPLHPDNPATLADLAQAPVLAQLPPLEPLTACGLAAQWQAQELGRTMKAAMGAGPTPHR